MTRPKTSKAATLRQLSRILLVAIMLLSGWSLAGATDFKILWLNMNYDWMTGKPVFVPIGGTVQTVQNGSVFYLPRYGNVMIEFNPEPINNLDHVRHQPRMAENGGFNGTDNYKWTTFDALSRTNRNGSPSHVVYTVTYTFLAGSVPPSELVLGVYGLGRLDLDWPHDPGQQITWIHCYRDGQFLGDWDLYDKLQAPTVYYGSTAFTAFPLYFELFNSLPGRAWPQGLPSFNTKLGVVRITNPVPVSHLTLDTVYQIGQDGISFTVGHIIPADVDSDAWFQDINPCDDGTEPNPCGPSFVINTAMWMSDDIRVSHSPLPPGAFPLHHVNPIAGQTNYVYVKLRSRGLSGVEGYIHLYWADASTGLAWAPSVPYDPNLGGWAASTTGGKIGTELVLNLGPSPDERVVPFTWVPPATATGHYSLLVRFVSGIKSGDPITFGEGKSIYRNTWYNNNIAWKSLIVVASNGLPDKFFLVRNVKDFPANVDLEFNSAGGGSGIPFLDGGSVRVVLSPEMFSNWMGAGGMGQGIIVNPDSSITLTSSLSKIQGTPMGVDEAQPVTMSFAPDSGSSTPAFQRFVVSQFSDGETIPDGGVTFEFRSGTGNIPTLTEWGLIIFGVVLLGFISWVFLKRRKAVVSIQ